MAGRRTATSTHSRPRRRRLAILVAGLVATAGALSVPLTGRAAVQLWINGCTPGVGRGVNLPPDGQSCLDVGLSPDSSLVPTLVVEPLCGDLAQMAPGSSASLCMELVIAADNGFHPGANVTIAPKPNPTGVTGTDLPKAAVCTPAVTATCAPTGVVNSNGGQFTLQFTSDSGVSVGDYQYLLTANAPDMVPATLTITLRISLPGYGHNGNNCNGCLVSEQRSYGNMTGPITAHNVFWGSAWQGDAVGLRPAADGTIGDEVATGWQSIMGQYGVGSANWGGSFTDTGNDAALGGTVTAQAIANELERVRGLTGWGNDSNTMWMVFLPPNVVLQNTQADPTNRAQNVCAWHAYSPYQSFTTTDFFSFGAIPYFNSLYPSCQPSSGLVASTTEIATHELAEAETDINGNGWYYGTPQGGEIGDLCVLQRPWQSTTYSAGSNYRGAAQMIYSNSLRDCGTTSTGGYWEVASDGGIFTFGNAGFFGSMGGQHLNQPIVGMAPMPGGDGYWEVASDGGIFPYGNATGGLGSLGNVRLNQPIVGMAATPDGKGYWMVAKDGGIFTFGDAQFFGSTGSHPPQYPVVSMTPTADGKGYWILDSFGEIFQFGDAQNIGCYCNANAVGMAAAADGWGYCIATVQLWVNSNGSCQFQGDMSGQNLSQPAVGFTSSLGAHGYYGVAKDGGIFTFGDAAFYGSEGGHALNAPMVGMAVRP
jgi:hypothetical protein